MEQFFFNDETIVWNVGCFIVFCLIALSIPVKDISIKENKG